MNNVILIKYGELTTKKDNRKEFINILSNNLHEKLKNYDVKIIKEYAEKDNRIRPFYSSENKGVSFSRNIGLKASTGEYIMFVDSDDELTKDAVRRMVDIANKYNSDYVDSYQIIKYTKNNKEYIEAIEVATILGFIYSSSKYCFCLAASFSLAMNQRRIFAPFV